MRASGVRQRHIDQAQSMNLYITNDYTLRKVLNLYVQAWENGEWAQAADIFFAAICALLR